MVDTLDLLTSFEAWDRLRVVQRLDRRQTEQTLADVLAAVLT